MALKESDNLEITGVVNVDIQRSLSHDSDDNYDTQQVVQVQ